MLFFRSLLFNICFFSWAILSAIIFIPLFIISTYACQMAARPWAYGCLLLARVICGIRYEVRGLEHLKAYEGQPVIIASKHQSAWDTVIFHMLLRCPAYILKRELLFFPFWGWYLWRMQMIAIDRSAKASSIKHMIKQAKTVASNNRSIIIFPEGTRTAPGQDSQYHPGVVALYSQLKLPVIPVALNSGLYWKKDAFIKHPGTIVLEFLPAIQPGMAKDQFAHTLKNTIETAATGLLNTAKPAS
jgi:1-acyl-sn-glycerol-3-phosphate acyltransferase